MQAVILAAGLGTRLYPYTKGIPKPLVPIKFKDGKITVVIERLIDQLRIAGVDELIVVVNYKKDAIIDYLGDGKRYNMNICYHFQEDLNGDAGALFGCAYLLKGKCIVLDADYYYEDDDTIKSVVDLFDSADMSLALATIKVNEVHKYAIMKIDDTGNVLDIVEKPQGKEKWDNMAKLGIYVFDSDILSNGIDIAKINSNAYSMTQMIKSLIGSGETVRATVLHNYFTDIGTWDNYQELFDKIHSGDD